jgi:hypothetical protein
MKDLSYSNNQSYSTKKQVIQCLYYNVFSNTENDYKWWDDMLNPSFILNLDSKELDVYELENLTTL